MSDTKNNNPELPKESYEWVEHDKRFAEARRRHLEAVLAWKDAGGYWPPGGHPSHPDEWAVVERAEACLTALEKQANPSDFAQLYQGMDKEDPNAIQMAISWLETDPFTRNSGYMKEKIMRRLCRMPMSQDQEERIRKLLLRLITRGPRQDFKYSCRLARRVDNEEFRSMLRQFLSRPEPQVASGAKRMLAACETKGTHKK